MSPLQLILAKHLDVTRLARLITEQMYDRQSYNKVSALSCPRVQRQLSNKHNLFLYVDQDLVEKSRNLGFNLSKTFENHLKQLLTQFSQVNASNNIENNENVCNWWAGPDLNRRPSARQADVLTELDYRPSCFH
jgi:post-segregation antitoxin (ccd killing protein)